MSEARYLPKADIVENKEGYELWLDMPGVAKEDLKVQVEKGELSIYGKTRRQQGRPFRAEYPVGDFSRKFTLGETVDLEKIDAQLSDGVLRLNLAKAKEVLPVEVQIH